MQITRLQRIPINHLLLSRILTRIRPNHKTKPRRAKNLYLRLETGSYHHLKITIKINMIKINSPSTNRTNHCTSRSGGQSEHLLHLSHRVTPSKRIVGPTQDPLWGLPQPPKALQQPLMAPLSGRNKPHLSSKFVTPQLSKIYNISSYRTKKNSSNSKIRGKNNYSISNKHSSKVCRSVIVNNRSISNNRARENPRTKRNAKLSL